MRRNDIFPDWRIASESVYYWTPTVRDQFLIGQQFPLIKHLGKICPIGRPQKHRSRRLNVLRGMESSRSAVTNDWHGVVPAPSLQWIGRRPEDKVSQGIPVSPEKLWRSVRTHTKMNTLQENLTPSTIYSRHTLPPALGLVMGSWLQRRRRSLVAFPGSANTLNVNTSPSVAVLWKLLLSCALCYWPQRDATPCCWCVAIC